MSTTHVPLPHTDTDTTHDDGGWGYLVAIIGFFLVLSIFTVPYFYDDTWQWAGNYTTTRVQPVYAPVVVDGMSVAAVGSSIENRSHTKTAAAQQDYPSLASLPVGGGDAGDNVCVHP